MYVTLHYQRLSLPSLSTGGKIVERKRGTRGKDAKAAPGLTYKGGGHQPPIRVGWFLLERRKNPRVDRKRVVERV